MKTITGWNPPNTSVSNKSGYSGLPGGYRNTFIGTFEYFGYRGYWWSSSETWVYYLVNISDGAARDWLNKRYGLSVRCLRD